MPKILLVEDDLGLQQLTKDYLEHNGLEVAVLERGDEVFGYLENNHADLMILDVCCRAKMDLACVVKCVISFLYQF